ncbi:hypothetical protein GGI22_007737, partial [Coemansia erecta]
PHLSMAGFTPQTGSRSARRLRRTSSSTKGRWPSSRHLRSSLTAQRSRLTKLRRRLTSASVRMTPRART